MVRCPKCGVVFKLGEDAKSAPPAAPKSAPERTVPPAPKSVAEKSPPAAPRSKPPVNKTNIATSRTDDRPPVSRRRSDDDYDDDYDDRDRRPRRRRRPSEKSGGNGTLLLVVGGLVGLLVVLGGLGLVGYLVFGGKKTTTPTPIAANNTLPVAPSVQAPNAGMATGIPKNRTNPSVPATTKQPESPPSEPIISRASPTGGGSVQDIYDYVLKSTSLIIDVMPGGVALGTGSVIDANDRLILTNYHVVANNQELIVFFPIFENGQPVKEYERYGKLVKERTKSPKELLRAEVIATDTQRDLAIIQVPKLPPGTEALPIAKTLVTIGQTVHSVGNPAGVSGAMWVYTQGAVRAVYRKKWKAGDKDLLLSLNAEVIETQSPTNHGDSGGPLVNDRGELVGVTQGGSATGQLISTFISVNEARDFIEREYQRKFAKPWSPVVRTPLRARSSGGADVTTLIGALDSKDAKARASAARTLGEMGPDAKLAIKRLVAALKDPDDLTRRASAEALIKIGAPARDDLQTLTDALKDPKPEVRRYASVAIGQIGPEASSAAEQLVDVLTDDDERVREGAARSLGSLGSGAKAKATPGLTKALKDGSKGVRVAAASALTNLLNPPSVDDVALFVSILKMQDPEASVFGARSLSKLGKQAKSALPDLMAAVKGSDPGVQRGAIDTMAAIGPDPKTAVPLYIAAFKGSSDSAVRQSSLHAIGELGAVLREDKSALMKDGAAKDGVAKDAVNAVLDATKDSDAQVKKAAFSAAAKLGALIGTAGAKQIMPSVIDSLQSKEAIARDQAFETVAGLGPLARDAVPVLITIMDKQDVKLYTDGSKKRIYLREADDAFLDKIAKTIGKVGHPAVKPLLASLNTTNLNWGLAIGICRSLGEVGPVAGRTAINQLRYISLGNNPPPVCLEADRALRKIQSK